MRIVGTILVLLTALSACGDEKLEIDEQPQEDIPIPWSTARTNEFIESLQSARIGQSRDEKLREWEDYYNYHCPHGALQGRTPYERLVEKSRADVSPGS